MSCPWSHDNVDILYGVPPMAIEDLPKICTCGSTITYSETVVFVPAPSSPSNGLLAIVDVIFDNTIKKAAKSSGNYCTCECHSSTVLRFMDCGCCDRCPYCKQDRIIGIIDHFNCCTQYLFHYNQGEPKEKSE